MGTEAYLRAALAPSTQKAYATAVSQYTTFCAERGFTMYPLRADHAAEWLTAMAEAGGRTAATITQYKSALHTLFASTQSFTDGSANPLAHSKLKRLLTGIANSKAAQERAASAAAPTCDPLTFDIVRRLRAVHSDNNPREVMLFAAIALATAACMRPSELLGSGTYPERALTADQVVFHTSATSESPVVLPTAAGIIATRCTVWLRITKTHLHGEERTVSADEAVQALWRWYYISKAQGRIALFQQGGTPLTMSALIGHLRRKLKLIGLGHMRVTGKCFRRGGASTLSALGADAADIAAAGGWAPSSTVWRTHYANAPEVKRARAIQVNAQMQCAIAINSAIGNTVALGGM